MVDINNCFRIWWSMSTVLFIRTFEENPNYGYLFKTNYLVLCTFYSPLNNLIQAIHSNKCYNYNKKKENTNVIKEH